MTDLAPPTSPDSAMRAVLVNRLPANALAAKFEHNLAVVIGINRYRHVRQLKTARPDAERLAALLQNRDRDIHDCYEVVTFYDEQAECTGLREYLSTGLPARVREAGEETAVNTRVLFYFAGHGDAEDGDAGLKGYLFPQDAQPEVEASLLDMAWVQEQLTNLPCRHVLIILDCCSAGALPKQASTRGALRPAPLYWDYLERYVGGKARQVITSAAHNQQALDIPNRKAGERDTGEDHSPFAQALFEALDPAFAGGSQLRPAGRYGVVTTTDLYQYVSDALHRRVGDEQTPGLWTLSTHEQGEFVFLLPGTRLELDPAPDLTKPEHNPWPHASTDGLQQAGLFAGRDREIEELAELVAAHPLVAVTGSSAVGKSSLVQAGLLPWLAEEGVRQPDEPDISWQILPPLTLDAQAPLQTLIKHINQTLGQSSESELEVALAVVWAHSGTGQRLLLALDLTEALFEPAAQAELSALVHWLEQATQMGGLHIVLTLRSDHWFMPGAGAGSERKHLLPSAIRYELGLMNRDGLRQVIERPAAARMIYLPPPEWINELVEAVEGEREPAALPILSAILHRMYLHYADHVMDGPRCGDRTRTLTLDDYNAVGGVEGVIADLAKCFHRDLPADAAYVTTLQQVLLRLVDVKEGRYVRRQAWQEEFDFPDVAATARAQAVIGGMTACGLAVQGANTEGRAYVELGHIALVQAWPLLGDCLREKSEEWGTLRALAAQVETWLPGRHKADLWHDDPRLPQVERMLWPSRESDGGLVGRLRREVRACFPPKGREPAAGAWVSRTELDFVRASVGERSSFRQKLLAGVAMFVIFVSLFAALAWWQRGIAVDNEFKAQTAATAEAMARLFAETKRTEAERAATNEAIARANAQEERTKAERAALESRSLEVTAAGREAFSTGNADTAIALAVQASSIDSPPEASLQALASFAYYVPGTRRVYTGHLGPVNGIALTPDGQRLLSGSTDKTAILRDVASGTILHRLEGHTAGITSVAISPDGSLGLTGSEDGTAILWKLDSGAEVGRLSGHQAAVNSVAFSPDGRQILTGSSDGTMVLWDVETQEKLQIHAKRKDNGEPDPIRAVAFSPNDERRLAAIASEAGDLCLSEMQAASSWDCTPGRDWWYPALSVAFSPAGDFLLGGLHTTVLVNWNVEKGSWWALKGHAGQGRSVAFRRDGLVAASGSDDNSIILWNPSETELGTQILLRLKGHTGDVNSVVFTPDGRQLLSGSSDGTIRLWDLTASTQLWQAGPPDGPAIWDAACYSRPSVVAVGIGGVQVWTESVDDWRGENSIPIIKSQTIAESSADMMALSPDGAKVLTGYRGYPLQLWDLESMRASTPYVPTNWQWVTSMAFSPDGNKAVSTYYSNAGGLPAPDDKLDRLMVLWDVSTGMPIRSFVGHRLSVWDAAFSPDGRTLLSASADDSLIVWDVASGQPIRSLLGHSDDVRTVAFSPLGDVALSGSDDGSLILWDTSTWEPIRRLTGHTARVKAVAVSPDGRRAISGSLDQSVILWDLSTGAMAGRFVQQTGEVTQVAFCPNGTFLSVAGGVVRLWDPELPEDLLGWVRTNRYVPQSTANQ